MASHPKQQKQQQQKKQQQEQEPQQQMDTLQRAFFGSSPRFLVSYTVQPPQKPSTSEAATSMDALHSANEAEHQTDGTRAPAPKHYLIWGRKLNQSSRTYRLWLIHPAPDAPPNTPPLCVLKGPSESSFRAFVAPLAHYSATAPGQDTPDWVPAGACRGFKRLRKGCVWFPAASPDEEVIPLVEDWAYSLKPMFQVS